VQKRYIIIGIIVLVFCIILTILICNRTDSINTDGIDRIETRVSSIEERVGIISSQSREIAEQNQVIRDLLTGIGKELSDSIGAVQDIGDTADRTTDGIQTGVEGLGRAIERAGVIEERLSELDKIIREKGWDNNTTESVPSN